MKVSVDAESFEALRQSDGCYRGMFSIALKTNDYHEDYYHAFWAGIFVGLEYAVESDREHGTGRPDILLKDRANRRALIIEAKLAKAGGEVERLKQEAVDQIRRGRYWTGLDGYRTILFYGLCFYRKTAAVKLLHLSEP